YLVVVTAAGYQDFVDTESLYVRSDGSPFSRTVKLQPSTRDVKLTFKDDGSSDPVDMSGWSVVLDPVSSPHQPKNETLTKQLVSVPGNNNTFQVPAVPTGTWSVTLRHLGTDDKQDDFDIPTTDNLDVTDTDTDTTPTSFTL